MDPLKTHRGMGRWTEKEEEEEEGGRRMKKEEEGDVYKTTYVSYTRYIPQPLLLFTQASPTALHTTLYTYPNDPKPK